jgi:hypothetical protein
VYFRTNGLGTFSVANISTMLPNLVPKSSIMFECKICDYSTSRQSQHDRHLLTDKHKNRQKSTMSDKESSDYICHCGKIYKERTGLWRHKKKCLQRIKNHKSNLPTSENVESLVQYLMKENSDFKQLIIDQNKQMIELSKNAGHNNITNNTNNTTNNNFNLNFFLNETCKDAMNIMDFVNQLNVSTLDLEETGRLGYSEGISKIFINGLKNLDIPDRPIHCSDFKRETLYIKDQDQWNKETEDKALLTSAIKHIAHKNIKQIKEWTKEHPEYNDSNSKQNDKYLNIVKESMSGSTQEETNKNYLKIIKNIARETIIDKNS